MKDRVRACWAKGLLVLTIAAVPSMAQNKIVAFVDASGRVMFSNNAENTPQRPSTPGAVTTSSLVASNSPAPTSELIESIAGDHGVDPALVRAMIHTESGFNRTAVSAKGALGLMQLIPTTGARYGVTDFFDARQNIEGGVRYMKFLLEKFNGDLDLSLAAYNAGENLVGRIGRIPSIPETRDYVRKVRAKYGKVSVPALTASPAVSPALGNGAGVVGPIQPRQELFRSVDERGVVHFSNVAPPK
jgi:soluble lytic murein transglycosylase-like protein